MTRIVVSENERTLVEQARMVDKLRAKLVKLTKDLSDATAELQQAQADMIASIARKEYGVDAKVITREEIAELAATT